jgi:hypothetical protein
MKVILIVFIFFILYSCTTKAPEDLAYHGNLVGAQIEARNRYSQTTLHLATIRNRIDLAKILLDSNAEVNARSLTGMTPLHWAAARGNFDMCKLLLSRGADVSARNRYKLTPLHESTQAKVTQLLLQHGAAIDARDENKMTPLHLAPNEDVAETLISAGANIVAKDRWGRTPLEMSSFSLLAAIDISVVTSEAEIRLPTCKNAHSTIKLFYRNLSDQTLTNLRLNPETDQTIQVKTRPKKIPRCQPAERCTFEVQVIRTAKTPEQKLALTAKLISDKHPRLHTLDLPIDATSAADKLERGWMPAGTIRIEGRSSAFRTTMIALLGLVPIVVLLGLGVFLKKRQKRQD